MDFFTNADLDLMKKWENTKYEKQNVDHQAAFNNLKKVYEKLEYWATNLKGEFEDNFELSIRKSPTNQAQRFESYLWCKLLPIDTPKVRSAITLAITSEGLELKIDRIGDLNSSEKDRFESAMAEKADKKLSYRWRLSDFEDGWDSCNDKSRKALIEIKKEFSYVHNKVNRIGLVSSVIWNSNGWMGDPTDQDMKHAKGFENVELYSMAAESINFAHQKYKADSENYYYGFSPQMNKLPTIKDIEIIVLISRDLDGRNKIIGYYKSPIIENFEKDNIISGEEIYKKYRYSNFKSKVNDIYALKNPIYFDEAQFLPDQKEKAKQRFNYIDGFCIDKILNAIHGDNTTMPNQTETKSEPKNLILFGPPGVGKTYCSVSKAVAIANPQFEQTDRGSTKKEFDRLEETGQIVFTTFHQSMSYEDFIEGIKPKLESKGEIEYEIKPGIFKEICDEAAFSNQSLVEEEAPKEVIEFSLAYDSFLENVRQRLSKNELVELDSKSGGTVIVNKISAQDNFSIKHHDGVREYSVSKYRLSKLFAAYPDLSNVSNINDQFKAVIGGSNSSAYWSVLNAVNLFLKNQKIDKKVLPNKKPLNFVLIIDEINRGNISQIFGELITLIEDNKRIGEDEELKVILPYSKVKFGVPSNLHIIGTMNTADRSVEALDTALRRRFCFEEITPDSNLIQNRVIEGIDLSKVLLSINSRIELLKDKDHLIGHSYFMNVANLKELKNSFQKNIIPLLQEYFYGDFGKIGLVLGSGFFERQMIEQADTSEAFADFENYEHADLSIKPIFRLKDVNSFSDEQLKTALKLLLKQK